MKAPVRVVLIILAVIVGAAYIEWRSQSVAQQANRQEARQLLDELRSLYIDFDVDYEENPSSIADAVKPLIEIAPHFFVSAPPGSGDLEGDIWEHPPGRP